MRNALIMLVAAVIVVELAYLVYRRQQAEAPQTPAETLQNLGHGAETVNKPRQNPRLGSEYLRGLVRDETGAPASGCRIIVAQAVEPRMHLARNARPPRWFQTTDAAGRFELDALPEGEFLVMALTETAHDARMARVAHAGAVSEAILRLRPSRAISGLVLGPDGQPAPQARVFAVETGSGATGDYAQLPAISSTAGRFSISYLPDAPCRLLAMSEGAGATLTEAIPPDQPTVTIALTPGTTVRGTLESLENGRPLPNVKLIFAEQRYGMETIATISDQNGDFRAGPLRPAVYRVETAAGRFVLAGGLQSLSLPQEGKITLKLVPAASLRGRVLDAEGRRGLPQVRVSAEAVDQPGVRRSASSDSSGYYRIEGLCAGNYRLSAWNAEGAGFRMNPDGNGNEVVVVAAKEAKGPDFLRMPGRRIEGTVLDAAGAPVNGANVIVKTEDRQRGTRSGADGRFLMEGAPVETTVRIRASVLDQVSVWYELTAQDLEGGALSLTLAHAAEGAIEGVAVNAQGAPVPEAYLRCMTPDDTLFTRADYRGVFSFEGLIPGEYHIAAGTTEAQARTADPQSHLRLEKKQRLREVRVVLP